MDTFERPVASSLRLDVEWRRYDQGETMQPRQREQWETQMGKRVGKALHGTTKG